MASISKAKLVIGVVLALLVLIVGGLTFADFDTGSDDVAPETESLTVADGADNTTTPDTQTDTNQENTPETTQTGDTSTAVGSDSTSTTGSSGGSSGSGSSGTSNTTGIYDISYTNNCYTPANRTIKQGETIRFINNSNRGMWPASDSHPAHNIYPEFDALKDTSPGGTYSFTFTKVGAWKYHDHSKPGCTGTITVQ